jgi:hypothetical protein
MSDESNAPEADRAVSDESEKVEPETASEQHPRAYGERTPEERTEDVLEEAADLPDRQFFRKREEIRWRLYRETGREWITQELVAEVRRRRKERQSAPTEQPPAGAQ